MDSDMSSIRSDTDNSMRSRPKTPDASEAYRQFRASRTRIENYGMDKDESELDDDIDGTMRSESSLRGLASGSFDDMDDDFLGEDELGALGTEMGRMSVMDGKELGLNELYQFIYKYSPIDIELDTYLEPFIPDYVPAIGDIDAFLKVPRPDGVDTRLGLEVLDEPDIEQSNPTILEIKLRSISKSAVHGQSKVHSIQDTSSLKSNPKQLNNWITSLEELHAARPPAVVKYSRPMPDLEDLMQAWTPEMEQKLKSLGTIPNGKHDIPLEDYTRMVLSTLDIAVKMNSDGTDYDKNGRSYIESLHVLFSLYSAFSQSHHFRQ